MPVIIQINYKIKSFIKAYLFAFLMYSKSSTMGNMSVFKNLNIVQINLDKSDI